VEFLRAELAAGPQPLATILATAHKLGISRQLLDEARPLAGVIAEREPHGAIRRTTLRLVGSVSRAEETPTPPPTPAPTHEPAEELPTPAPRPRWDTRTGELWYGDVLCRRYAPRAFRQRCILDTFEDDGWPRRIDDPLPEAGKLKDTLKDMNRDLRSTPLQFRGDGTGEGIVLVIRSDR
jgi:hypothetical protein